MDRLRERALALRPLMEAMTKTAEAERQARNFAFTEMQIAAGKAGPRERFILVARQAYCFDWDRSVRYAEGRNAAEAGWHPRERPHGSAPDLAYDHGFRDGGGNRDDLFDTARRALVAPRPRYSPIAMPARPLPSDWPKPSDAARPARWDRRLLVLGAVEAGSVQVGQAAGLMPDLERCPGFGAMLVIVSKGGRLRRWPGGDGLQAEPDLADLLVGREFDDVLIAAMARGDLDLIDAHHARLPLCRTMERTRNSVLQQRQQFRTWLSRGYGPGETLAGGHIRWGKAIQALTGRLGEFTARYAGKDRHRGHRICVEIDGAIADGFFAPSGAPLPAERFVSNKAHLRRTMAEMLRAFAASMRLGPSSGTSDHRSGS
jgi:hypothetical protein